MKKANCVSIDSARLRLKTPRTDGISGSIIEVMKPHAKNSVVTEANAAFQSYAVFGIVSSPWISYFSAARGASRPVCASIRRECQGAHRPRRRAEARRHDIAIDAGADLFDLHVAVQT